MRKNKYHTFTDCLVADIVKRMKTSILRAKTIFYHHPVSNITDNILHQIIRIKVLHNQFL